MPRRGIHPESPLVGHLSPSSGWSRRRFHGPLLLSITVASLPSQRYPGGTRWGCLPRRQVDRSLLGGGIGTTAIWVLRRRDHKVGQVPFNIGRGPTGQQVIIRRGDGTGWGWVTLLVIHFHGMGLTFSWGGLEDCSGALTDGVLPVSGAIAISDSAASPAPWSDESSSSGAASPDLPTGCPASSFLARVYRVSNVG